jgi:hypothetical protein
MTFDLTSLSRNAASVMGALFFTAVLVIAAAPAVPLA